LIIWNGAQGVADGRPRFGSFGVCFFLQEPIFGASIGRLANSIEVQTAQGLSGESFRHGGARVGWDW